MNQSLAIFLLGLTCGLWQWFAPPQRTQNTDIPNSYQWPESFEGEPLTQVAITDMEHEFSKGFPGEIGNFICHDKQVIMRYVTRATRKLHPATDCLRASGHHIGEVKVHTDTHGHHWSGCKTIKSGEQFFLRERITSINNDDKEWCDVSSWYWSALTEPHQGPWLAVTVISRVEN